MKESGLNPEGLGAKGALYLLTVRFRWFRVWAGAVQSRVKVDGWGTTDWPRRETASQGKARAEAGSSWSVTSWGHW